MSNVSRCFLCVRKNDYDPKFGYYGCKLSGQECKGYSMFEPKVKPKPITNYDRIRAKSVEEMAEWCFIITYNVACYYQGDEKLKYPVSPLGWLDWLKQEAEE